MLFFQYQKGVICVVQFFFSNGVCQIWVMLVVDNFKCIVKQDVILDVLVVIVMGIDNEIGLKLIKLVFGIVYWNVVQ